MYRLIGVLFVMLLTAMPVIAEVKQEDWELRRDKNGIKVYTRKVEGSPHKALKAITYLDSKLTPLVALLSDVDACTRLSSVCEQSYVHKQMSDTDLYVYTWNNLPWPVKDRDIIARIRWSQDPVTGAVVMTGQADANVMPKQSGRMRIQYANVRWELIPLEDGQVKVVNEAHIDPAGNIPAALANFLLVDTPFETFSKIKELMVEEKYQNARLPFIKER